MSLDAVFKAYDIRGVYPDEIDETLARRIGNAFAHFTGAQHVVVGRDMRPSSEPLAAAFIEGATLAGADVTDVGLASTDLVYFASGHLDAPGAMFTASHNPAKYNGIKLCRAGAAPVGEQTGLQQIKEMVASGVTSRGEVAGKVERVDLLEAFGDHVRSFVDTSVLKPLKVVADTANGMGGLVVPKVFEGLPFSLTVLFGELDGIVPEPPRRPDPAREPEGPPARGARPRTPTSVSRSTATPTACSSSTTRACRSAGPPPPRSSRRGSSTGTRARRSCTTSSARTRCPRSSASTAARRCGPGSGTRSSSRSWPRPARSSAASTPRTTTSATTGGPTPARSRRCSCSSSSVGPDVPLSELRKPFERYVQSGEINSRVDDPSAVIETVAAEYATNPQDRLDGLTVDCGEWWFNLRPSNTEPLLRLNLEAPDAAQCDAHTREVLALIRAG